MTVHSKIGASSMYRWSQCPGSVKLSEGIETKSSSYAEEGTKAHELAAIILTANIYPVDADKDMLEAVLAYTEVVKADAGENEILVEQRFDLSEIYPGLFGTADAVVYDPKTKLLRVYDYKHGQGILVEVQDNSQLMYYGLGALLHTKYPCSEVELVIGQPRASHVDGPVRRWRFKSFDLVEFAADLRDFAAATAEPNAPLNAGGWCRFCPASGICPELRKQALTVAQREFKPQFSYDPAQLADTLKKLEVLESYTKSVREFAYNEAEHGRCPPGFKLVQKRATRKWKDCGNALPAGLSKEFDLALSDIYEPMSIKSPAQIKKLLPKEHKKKLEQFTVLISSGMTLVEDSDPRPGALMKPEEEFKKIEPSQIELLN